jgi:hypothetical protein
VADRLSFHCDESAADGPRGSDEARMFHAFLRTLVKVTVACLIVGTIMAHFGVTPEQVLKELGLSHERVMELARQGVTWALPNLFLGSLIILPVWFLIYLFRPPRARSD